MIGRLSIFRLGMFEWLSLFVCVLFLHFCLILYIQIYKSLFIFVSYFSSLGIYLKLLRTVYKMAFNLAQNLSEYTFLQVYYIQAFMEK